MDAQISSHWPYLLHLIAAGIDSSNKSECLFAMERFIHATLLTPPFSTCRMYKYWFRVVFYVSSILFLAGYYQMASSSSLVFSCVLHESCFFFSVDVEHFRWILFSLWRAVCFTPDVFILPSAILIMRLHSHIISQVLSTFWGGGGWEITHKKEAKPDETLLLNAISCHLQVFPPLHYSPPKMKNQFRIHAAVPGCWFVFCSLW